MTNKTKRTTIDINSETGEETIHFTPTKKGVFENVSANVETAKNADKAAEEAKIWADEQEKLANEAENTKPIKRNRKPQAEANVSLFVNKYTEDMYHVYAKQGHSIVAVYGFIPSIDSFLNLAPTNEIAKAWGSMYEMVKAVSQQVGTFQPAIAHNIQFVNTLVATVIKANTLTTKLAETEITV